MTLLSKLSSLVGSVECLARLQDFAEVIVRPEAERLDRAPQGMSEWGQSIIDSRRRVRCHRASHETVALQAAKRKGEHALRDAADQAFDLIEPLRSMPEQHHDQHGPFVRHPSEDGVESATVMTVGVREFNGHLHVPTSQWCAFLRALSQVSTLYQVAGCYRFAPISVRRDVESDSQLASVHASVEQFITAIDEHLCDTNPDFRFMRPDFRLLALVQAATTRLQDFVVTARRGCGCCRPARRQAEARGRPFSRSAAHRRKTRNPRQFELTERFIRAFRGVSADQLEETAKGC